MSVEKVNKYKEEKANRKEILAKQKKKAKAVKAGLITGGVVIVALIAVAIGVTIRNERIAYLNSLPDYNTSSMVLADLSGVLATEAETSGEEQTGTEAETEAQTEASSEETSEETGTAEEETAAEETAAEQTEAASETAEEEPEA